MKFRLNYEGELLGATNKSPRAAHKHQIRRALEPQLRRIWEDNWKSNKQLYGLAQLQTGGGTPEMDTHPTSPQRLGNEFQTGGFRCVPLILERDRVFADVYVLLFRPGPLGVILKSSGDLDNRLATIFDALQIPQGTVEMKRLIPIQSYFACSKMTN